MIANRAASIRARLKRIADESREDFNLVLTRYGIERLLYQAVEEPLDAPPRGVEHPATED